MWRARWLAVVLTVRSVRALVPPVLTGCAVSPSLSPLTLVALTARPLFASLVSLSPPLTVGRAHGPTAHGLGSQWGPRAHPPTHTHTLAHTHSHTHSTEHTRTATPTRALYSPRHREPNPPHVFAVRVASSLVTCARTLSPRARAPRLSPSSHTHAHTAHRPTRHTAIILMHKRMTLRRCVEIVSRLVGTHVPHSPTHGGALSRLG